MAEKTGAGGRPQEYDEESGRYGSNGGVKEYRQNTKYDEIISDKSTAKFIRPNSEEFHAIISEAKQSNPPETRWRVDVHDAGDYGDDELFVTEGGSTIAVEPDGNIISVCKNKSDTQTRGADLLRKAISEGGDRLDAFGKDLYKFYTRNGFEPVSYTTFKEEYAPEGWQKGRDNPEPVIFYKYTGNQPDTSYEDFLRKIQPSSDYDEAKSIRDKEMEE